MTGRPPLSDPVDPLAHDDPVAAVLEAHAEGRLLRLGTSGSTGPARPVVRSTASWFDSFPVVARLTGLGTGSRVWVPGPSSGTMNLYAGVLAAASGATLVDDVERATHAHLTPTELRRVVARRRVAGLHVTVAGDRLPGELHRAATDAGATVDHYYGAAELSFVAWGPHEEGLRPFPDVDVRVRDGVLWVRSPYLAEVTRDGDGFATVGDHGTVTADGRIVVTGRGSSAVTTGGATVPVEPVEAVLAGSSSGEVAVVGVPHPELGEVVAAVLTRHDDLLPAQLTARERLAGPHRPRLWFLADDLPRTPAGKTDRAALRTRAAAGGLRRLNPVLAR